MSGYYKTLVLVLFVTTVCQGVAGIDTEYVDTNCDSTIYVYDNKLILLDKYMAESMNNDCQIRIKSLSSTKKVQLSFLEFNVPCDEGVLAISGYTYYTNKELLLCGDTLPTRIYKSYQDKLTITFRKITRTSASEAHFKLLATQIHTGVCSSFEFECDNSICVNDYDVTCNGYDNCGDNSDETKGCILQPGVIVAIVLGCLAAVFLIVVICIVVYRKKKYGSICNGPPTRYMGTAAQPGFVMTTTQSGQPQQFYGQPQPMYGQPQQVNGQPQPMYVQLQPMNGQPQPAYGQPQQMYGQPQPMYGQTNAAMMPPPYAEVVSGPGQPPPSTTVDSKPAGNTKSSEEAK